MVKLYSLSPLWTMITTFQEESNMHHISEPIIRRFFSKTCATLFTSSRAVFIDSFSFAVKRCNTWQGFGAFFVQSCRWSILVPFLSLFTFSRSFLIFFKIVVNFLIKQLFHSGLLDIKWLWPTRRYAPIIWYPACPRRIIVKYLELATLSKPVCLR